MTDQEKIEMLERENKMLKEQIELLKEIKSLKNTELIGKITLPADQPHQPYWTYSSIEYLNKC